MTKSTKEKQILLLVIFSLLLWLYPEMDLALSDNSSHDAHMSQWSRWKFNLIMEMNGKHILLYHTAFSVERTLQFHFNFHEENSTPVGIYFKNNILKKKKNETHFTNSRFFLLFHSVSSICKMHTKDH